MRKIIWIVVNCNSVGEADRIGKAVLKERFAACYDIVPREKAAYFWPPTKWASLAQRGGPPRELRSDRSRGEPPRPKNVETAKGAMLILNALPKHARAISGLVKKLHSDTVPFVGLIPVDILNKEYYDWMKNETR